MQRYCRLSIAALLTVYAGLAAAAEKPAGDPVAPREVVKLFNGKDFTGFYTWLKATGYEDPHKVFTVEDGVIHVSGEGAGYLATEKAYKDYHLVVEYKWGKRTDGSKYVRNSGVLLHGIGPDGAANGTWTTCLECQLAQGCEGDLIVIRGKDASGKPVPATITCETEIAADKKTRWKQGGTKTVYSGKQFWWSKHQPFFEELRDTRGKDDVASPLGQWTKVECLCDGSRVTIKINGVAVNECFDAFPAAGKILLQNEGNEIYFRNVELHPLKKKSSSD
jgi:hypothetical protein